MKKQRTVAKSVSWAGRGLHTGLPAVVHVHAAEEGFGIKFRRLDIEQTSWIMSEARFVSSTIRCTSLKSGGQEVMTVEHLLAALSSLGISNARVEVDGPELPILDGSISAFIDKIMAAGMIEQEAEETIFELTESTHFICPNSGAEYFAFPSDTLSVNVQLTLDPAVIGHAIAGYKEGESFNEEIGGARTFVMASEIIDLAKSNLIKGGDLDNAMVLGVDKVDLGQLSASISALGKTNVDEILEEISRGSSFRYPNEPARHKLGDLIGDLVLVGAPIKARIVAIAPGHTGNVAFAKHLREFYVKQQKGVPHYDPTKAPVVDIEGVQAMLPHRYPFLLVDKVIELSETHVIGVKNITFNEPLFQGHFPNNSVFPGVLQMEALAQAGGILALSMVDNPSDYDTYFLKMDQVKFKRKVVPGDTLLLKMELMAPIRRGIVQMKGTTYVGDQIASEGELTSQIVDRTKIK